MGDRIDVTASNGAIGVNYGTVIIGEGPRRLALSSGCTPLPTQPLPSQYLVARHEVVDFAGRDDLLADLAAWATSDHIVRVRLLTGPAGAGKTRLGQAWVRACRVRGEVAGFLDDALEPAVIDALAEADGAVVIDYAETRSGLGALLTRLARRRDEGRPGRLRVLLFARGIGDWWRLATRDDAALALVQDHEPHDLPPITDRAAEFSRAAAFFQVCRGWATRPPPPDLSDAHYGRPLYLHLAAWLAGEGERLDLAEDLPGRLLNHEAKYWLKRGGFDGRTDAPALAFELAMQAAVAALALRGGARNAAHLARVADAAPCALLPTLYPAPGLHVGPLQPDLLAEVLVLRHLQPEPEARIDAALAAAEAAELRTAFTLLARAEAHDAALAARAQAHLLSTDLDTRAPAALAALLALAERTAHATLGQRLARALEARGHPKLAARLEPALPWESVMLREVAVWVEQTLVPTRPPWWVRWFLPWRWKPERRAAGLHNLSKRLADLGCREEALAAITEAVRLRRRVARFSRGSEAKGWLANNLSTLGVHLSALGGREEALAATNEAVELYRTLAAARPDAFLPDLARSLNNLGSDLSDLGRREEALAATTEAVELRRTLAAARPDAFLPDLASSLNNLGATLSALGSREEALAATAEAVELRRTLAAARPDAFLPDLAGSLNNLGAMLSALGRREEALAATTEAVERYRTLAAARPDAFLPELARSVSVHGDVLAALGRDEEARQAADEALDLLWPFFERHPAAHARLMRALLNDCLTRHGDPPPPALAARQQRFADLTSPG